MNCAKCTQQNCQVQIKECDYPGCPMGNEEFFDAVEAEYRDPEIAAFYAGTLKSMRDSFGRLTRVDEAINFCKLMDFKKIGVVYCSGMLREGRIANEAFKQNGFETVSVGCKTGGYSSVELAGDNALPPPTTAQQTRRDFSRPDFQYSRPESMRKRAICNPIGQAMLMNAEKTDFNVVTGLCVGHDSLFLKYADAMCTVLVAKDRMLHHNTVADLYAREAFKTV